MIISTRIEPAPASTTYLFAEAKKRGIGPEELLRRVIKVVLELQLVDDTLDDDGNVAPVIIPEKKLSPGKHMGDRLSLRQCEVDILGKLGNASQICVADIEPRESKRMTWYKAVDNLCREGKIIKLPRTNTRDRQYFALPPLVETSTVPEVEGSGSLISLPPCASGPDVNTMDLVAKQVMREIDEIAQMVDYKANA